MPIEIFEKGIGYVLGYFALRLVFTLFLYGAFPLLYALIGKDKLVESRYKAICYIVNAVIAVVLLALNGGAGSAFPYILWTPIFISLGLKIAYRHSASKMKESIIVPGFDKPRDSLGRLVCKKCGTSLPQGETRCDICGTDNFG